MVDARDEDETRVKRLGFSGRYYQTRTNTTRVYEQDCTSATDRITTGYVGTVKTRSIPRKDHGNRFFRTQLVTVVEGEWVTGATY